jgi:hypothetical protein
LGDYMRKYILRLIIIMFSALIYDSYDLEESCLYAATTTEQYGGHKDSWPSSWTTISGLNDQDNGLSDDFLDFVGDATDPGAYVAWDSSYLYFRMRVDVGTANALTWEDCVMIVLDSADSDTTPNWGISWDTYGQKNIKDIDHGLEMNVPNTTGSTWAGTKLHDLDGVIANKIAPPDFRYIGGDGYVRTVDSQSTSNFGTTTFIDFALSWEYLNTATSGQLVPGTSWNIQLVSIANNTDHAFINADVAGGLSPSSSLTYSAYLQLGDAPAPPEETVPEPATIIGALGGILFMAWRKTFTKK